MQTPVAERAAAELWVFDAYGTLFDVHAAVANEAEVINPDAAKLSAAWRDRQLAYTWLRAAMGRHQNFWTVTQDALDVVLAQHGVEVPGLRDRLLGAYWRCAAFPEVVEVLGALRAAGRRLAILSNGTPDMLAAAVEGAGLAGTFEAVLSVEEVGVFKPAPAVYGLVEARLGVPPRAVCFLSSNGWDAHAGAAFGFASVWVNRQGLPDERLPGTLAGIVPSLRDLLPTVAG